MEIWIQETWLSYFIPLGWALFHSLWQSLLIFISWKILNEIFPKMSPKIRYGLGFLFLASMFLLFWSGIYKEYSTREKPLLAKSEKIFRTNKLSNLPLIRMERVSRITHFWESNTIQAGFSIWGFIYILCLIWMAIRLFQNLVQIHYLKNPKNLFEPEKDLIQLYEKLKKRIPFPSGAKLFLSGSITSPITFGHLKPFILFPLGICTKLTLSQMEGLLIHEMAHIIRRDYLFNFLQGLVETFLFFNPFVWILNREIRSEREKCCDDWVSDYYSGSSIVYAQTLLHLEEERQIKVRLSIAALGPKNELFTRIQRIMKKNETPTRYPLFTGLISLFIGIGLIGLLSSGKLSNKTHLNLENSLKKASLWSPDTNHKPQKPGPESPGPIKELEDKKFKEILAMEMSEKNLEMDSMNKILSLKSMEMNKLGELIGLKGKEINELVNRRKQKIISASEFDKMVAIQDKQMDSLNQMMGLKDMEMKNYSRIMEIKEREMDSINHLRNTKGYILDNQDNTYSYSFKTPEYSYQYTLPYTDTDRESSLDPIVKEPKAPQISSRKLIRIQKKLNKLNPKDLDRLIGQSIKQGIGSNDNLMKKDLEEKIKKSLEGGKYYSFSYRDKSRDPEIKMDVLSKIDEEKLNRDIEQSIENTVKNKIQIQSDLDSKIRVETNTNTEKIREEIEKARKYTDEEQNSLHSSYYKLQLEKALKDLIKAENLSQNPEFKESMKEVKKELEKAKEELMKIGTKPFLSFPYSLDFHIDSLGHKDSIRFRKLRVSPKKPVSSDEDQ